MSNGGVNMCPEPFIQEGLFGEDGGGFIDGRFCRVITERLTCCLPCPITDWVYEDYFDTVTAVANGVSTASAVCCVFLLLSWLVLPVEKTNRHYLSVCLTVSVLIMNLGFVVPLIAQPDECYDRITPHSMSSSTVCGASGTLLLLGGFAGLMWAFMRSLSLHLQICWQVLVGRNFMIFAQAAGWLVPIIGIVLALVFSGVSFRFGATCHINHDNSLAVFWIPLLVFAALTVIITFATFGYCIKVYLASLSDNNASTEGSGLPAYTNTVTSLTPRQAYRRVHRVISMQWRGIAIVLIIIADVIFFSIVFVFQDTSVQNVKDDPSRAEPWVDCLSKAKGDKNQCLQHARSIVVNVPTVTAVLLLLSLNGIWLVCFLGRWTMVTGWGELFRSLPGRLSIRRQKDFVSVDARFDSKHNSRSYEMLSKDASVGVTPLESVRSPEEGRQTPDYFGQTARHHAPTRSYSSTRTPGQPGWDPQSTYASPHDDIHPLSMNKS